MFLSMDNFGEFFFERSFVFLNIYNVSEIFLFIRTQHLRKRGFHNFKSKQTERGLVP
jgi:hypothetical protein